MALLSLAHLLVLLPFLSTATTAFSSTQTHQTPEKVACLEEERQALLTFKDGLRSPNNSSLLLSSWVGSDCCNWMGIGCNNTTSHVVRLDLHDASIDVPFESGELNTSLLELNHLEYLDLSNNSFGFSPIPKFFGSFKKLKYLNLSCACFDGAVPSQLGNLSHLQSLDLSCYPWLNYENYLNVHDFGWVSDLSSLKYLYMDGVNLSRANDWFQVTNLLPSLSTLTLSNCSLKNLPILTHPNLTTLTHLDLSENDFASKFPSWLVNLTQLEFLDLGSNSFEGSLPDSFENLSNLEYLGLAGNSIKGPISRSIGCLCNLQVLDLHFNEMQGDVNGFLQSLSKCCSDDLENDGRSSSMRKLNLHSNNFSGTVPESVGQLSELEQLDLSYNSLEGVIYEAHFANLTRLESLWISGNSLVFNVSQDWIPPTKLIHIRLGSCRLGPKFPRWLWFLKDYSGIDLSNNQISDAIPTWFWNLSSKATIIDLSNNHLTGQIPSCLGNFTNLVYLDLSNNSLGGEIPSSFGNIPYLSYFFLENNNLTGQIPSSIANLTTLIFLNLSNNSLDGTIPTQFYNPSLQLLLLNHNHFHGVLPLSLTDLTTLVAIDLSKNKLFGSLETCMWESLTQLKFLNLRSNMFHGNIPPQLSQLVSLQVLDLADNHLSGVIPSSFSNFTAMARTHNLSEAMDPLNSIMHLWLIMKGVELEFTKTIFLWNIIDLSGNGLSGEIPKGLVRLTGLKSLNLSGNHLEGSIPKDIGNLLQLESLDFSRNHLSGTIPLSISALNFLSSLNLSYNNLSGHIPLGRQLQTFNSSSFMGNYNLCGTPLSECPDGPNPIPSTFDGGDEEDRSKLLWFSIGAAMGFVIGFWAICGTLILNKSWRISYYGFFDKLIARLNLLVVNIILKVKKK